MKHLNGKTALVTGAGGYIGNAVAVALANAGAKVAVCDINLETVKHTLEEIKAKGGEAEAFGIDVTLSKSVDEVVNKTVERFGSLDICIHVAGGSARIAGEGVHNATLVNREDFVIDYVLKVNLYGAFFVSRAAAKQMISQGNGGKIINFSSIVGINGLQTATEYAAAKGGVIAMTKSLAKELGEYGINVNSVAPGVVARPGEDDNDKYVYHTNYLNKKCLATDIADVTEFLASDKANFITGQTYIVDGGRSLAMKGSD